MSQTYTLNITPQKLEFCTPEGAQILIIKPSQKAIENAKKIVENLNKKASC